MSLPSHYANVDAWKVARFAKWVAPFPHTFFFNQYQPGEEGSVVLCRIYANEKIFEPFSLNSSYLGNQPTGFAAL